MADNLESKYVLDITDALSKMDQLDNRLSSHETRMAKLASTNPFKEAARGAADFDKELSAGTKDVAALEAALATYKEEIKKAAAEQVKLNERISEMEAAWKHDKASKGLQEVQTELGKTEKGVEATTQKVGGLRGMLDNAKAKWKEMTAGASQSGTVMNRVMVGATRLAGLLAVAVGATAVAVYNARNRYMEMNDALLAVSGNQKSVTNNLEILDDIATQLDTSLRNVAGAFNLLNSNGLAPTKSELKNIGVLAKESKSDLTALSEAIVAADKGQIDALTKLGFQAQVQGNKVQISFRGVTETFKKGSGDAVKALDEIAKKIELTENSSSGLGRMDFMDRLAKGFVDAEVAISEAAETTDKQAYPTFERFERLIDRSRVAILNWAESFGIWVSVGWQKIKTDADLLLAGFAYFADLWQTRSFEKANANMGKAWDAFLRNRDIINEQERIAQSKVGQNQGGQLINNGPKLRPEDKEAQARAKAQRTALLKAEKDLKDELLKLEKEYGKEKLEALWTDYLKYLEKKKELSLKEIDLEEQALLKLKQIVSGARKGMFDKDNRVIPDKSAALTDSERASFQGRRGLVSDLEYRERAKFISENEREITHIISNEFQQRLQETEYRYEELFKLAKQSGIDIAKLEKQKQKEITKILLDKSLADLERKELQEVSDAELNVIRAQIKGRSDLELEGQKGLLEIEKKFALEKIRIIEASGDKESGARVIELKKTIAEIDRSINTITKEQKKQSKINNYLKDLFGLSDDQLQEAINATQMFASTMMSIMSDLYNNLNQLSQQRIQQLDKEIDKKEDQIKTEGELSKEGLANNLDLRQKELEELKAVRAKALEDQKRIQRAQLALDSVSQVSSLITATSKVYATLSGAGPFGVAIATAAVAAMFGAFAFAKIKAFQLINSSRPDQYEYGGEIKGKRHSEGGEIIEAEDGEFVTNRRATAKYRKLIESINNDDRSGILDYLVRDMLAGTGVGLPESDRNEMMKVSQEYHAAIQRSDNDLVSEIRALKEEMKEVKKNTSNIPRSSDTALGGNRVLTRDHKTGSKIVVDYTKIIDK